MTVKLRTGLILLRYLSRRSVGQTYPTSASQCGGKFFAPISLSSRARLAPSPPKNFLPSGLNAGIKKALLK